MLAAVELVQRRQRVAVEPHTPVGVVLEDGQRVLPRQLDEPPPPVERERPSTRVLEGRQRVEEGRRGVAPQFRFERVDVEPVVVLRERPHLRPEPGGDLQRPVVRGSLDEDPPPGREVAEHEVEPRQRAVRDQHTARLDAVPLGEPLPERPVTPGRPVVEDRLSVTLQHLAGAIGELGDGEALWCRHAARERDHPHVPSVVGVPETAWNQWLGLDDGRSIG